MQILGIQFAPLRVPLERRLQTLGASWFIVLLSVSFLGFPFSLYLLFTRLWWLISIYFGWIYFDRHICDRGGRPLEWVKNLKIWWYFRDYFPLHLARVSEAELDPKRNYLFCFVPHGAMAIGCFNAFGANASEFRQLFPNHTARVATFNLQYIIPFFREIALSLGGISASAESLNYMLSCPEGGKIVVLIPGGLQEPRYSIPGQYKTLLKNRKGFVKLSLRNGTALVPVISFGENELLDRVHWVEEWVKKYIGIVEPLVLKGRGFFQYSFGIIPHRREVTTLVGPPIDVTKTENPTAEQIEQLHETFITALNNLFEEYKYKYLKDPENKRLEII